MNTPRRIPNDGIIDDIAIERRINGENVTLTRDELERAVHILRDRGVGKGEICSRLRMNGTRYARITRRQVAS